MIASKSIPRVIWHFFLCFLSLFAYYLLVFDPSLYAHHHHPVFFVDRAYFQQFLRHPGGLIEWGTQFFFQFSCFRLAGSLLLAAVSVAILVLIYQLLKELGDVQHPILLACVPWLLFLTQQNHYSFPLVIGVKYSCVVALLILYARLTRWQKKATLLLSAAVYLALGGWWFLFYGLLCGIYEVLYSRERGRYVYVGLSVLAYVSYPFLAARFLFLINLREAYFYIVPYELYQAPYLFHPDVLLYSFFLSLPLLLLGYSCYVRLHKDGGASTSWLARRSGPVALSGLSVLAGISVLLVSSDAEERKIAQVDLLAAQSRWEELLPVSREMRHGSLHATFHTNRALYHTGRLLEDMFSYRQTYGADGLFLTRRGAAGQVAMPSSDLYMDLGHVKASQVMAYEGQTRQKHNPRILRRLALTNIINGSLPAAEKFLGLLDRSLLHRGWARRWRGRLADGLEQGAGDSLQSKRSQMPKTEFFINVLNPERDLRRILTEDTGNDMAREYLLAHYLLECRLGDLLSCLREFSPESAAMPRHVEEALILIKATRPEALRGTAFRIRSRTVERFLAFNRVISQHPQMRQKAAARERGFGNTYWYYGRYIKSRQAQSQLKKRRIDVDVL